MKKITILALTLAVVALILNPAVSAETENRKGSPRVIFKSFGIQSEASQGDFITASAFFQLTAPIEVEEKVFFHLAKAGQSEVSVNADFYPRVPTRRWEVGEVIEAGPINLAIPYLLAPGEYEIHSGLMQIIREETGVRYLREAYANPDIQDFVIGKITIKKAPEPEEEKKPRIIDLARFESPEDILLWESRGAGIEIATEGDRTIALVTVEPRGEYPGIALENYFGLKPELADWSLYDGLEVSLGLPPGERPERLFLQIRDRSGRAFKKEIRLNPGEEKKTDLSMVAIGGEINISAIEELKLFKYRPEKGSSFYINALRLYSRGMPTGKPAVTFVRLEAPERVKRGEVFKVKFYFSLNQPIFPTHKMFVHVYRQYDLKGAIGTDIQLYPPIRDWPLEQEIAVESAPLMISPESPPGNYMIRAGLYIIIESPGEGYVKVDDWEEEAGKIVTYEVQPTFPRDYVKQPYTNLEIKDWEVGKVVVE